MAETQRSPHVTEGEARAVAEASRETKWEAPSFLKELFLGRLHLGLIHPHPEPDPDEQARAREWLARFRHFLETEVDPEQIEHEAKIPMRVVDGLRALGAFGIKIPREYGGLGLSQYTYGHAMALAGTRNGALVALMSAHQSIGVPQPLKIFGTEEQKKRLLPRLARGAISAFALTENDVGSDPARMSTTATLTPDGSAYEISGEKLWCTNGAVAELLVVMARTTSKDGKSGITAFVVETNAPGVEIVHRLEFMGIRGIENAVIRFHKVRVPKENLLLGEGRGLKLALVTLNTGRLTLPATCAYSAKWCLEVARRFAAERVQWGRPVGQHDAVAQMLARMSARTYAMEAMADLCALLADGGRTDIRLEAAIAKMWNSDGAWEVCDDAIQVRGGRGYETARSLASRGEAPIPLEQVMRDLRINRIFEGTNQVMRLFIAREALDTHLKVAGDAVMPNVPLGRRLQAFVRAGLFYAVWYPSRWLSFALPPAHSEFGRLAKHVRWVERTAAKLARTQFHLMVMNGPALEKKQSLLFRCVDVGAELFAQIATCVRARRDAKAHPGVTSYEELADLFCMQSRRRIAELFRGVGSNDDAAAYKLARAVLDGKFAWLEEGIIPAPTEAPASATHTAPQPAAAGTSN